jgi:KDO2-lipid IV(A) lauroyltransferase
MSTEGSSQKLLSWLLLSILRGLAKLPLPVCRTVGRWIGRGHYLLNSRAAMVTRTNIELCFPSQSEAELEALVKSSLIHTCQTMMETPAAWLGNLDKVSTWITRIEGEELLDEAVSEGKGVVVLLPHHGNWEMLNVYFVTHFLVTGLFHPPRQAYLRQIMNAVREHLGNEIVPTSVKGLATLYRRLAEGRVVVVLPDQVPSTGDFVPFFGVDAMTDRLVSRLVKKSGARAVCASVLREQGGGFSVQFTRADSAVASEDLQQSMRGVNRSIENCVKLDPAQYQWEYKRFKERPAGAFRLYNYKDESASHH